MFIRCETLLEKQSQILVLVAKTGKIRQQRLCGSASKRPGFEDFRHCPANSEVSIVTEKLTTILWKPELRGRAMESTLFSRETCGILKPWKRESLGIRASMLSPVNSFRSYSPTRQCMESVHHTSYGTCNNVPWTELTGRGRGSWWEGNITRLNVPTRNVMGWNATGCDVIGLNITLWNAMILNVKEWDVTGWNVIE
jgi:hypothetical protein